LRWLTTLFNAHSVQYVEGPPVFAWFGPRPGDGDHSTVDCVRVWSLEHVTPYHHHRAGRTGKLLHKKRLYSIYMSLGVNLVSYDYDFN
jgi:hypothetical protein